jgi:hypothetical protein
VRPWRACSPTKLNLDAATPSLFLAGSIEMGASMDWQSRVANALEDLDVVILNPRRDAWDSSWEQFDNPQFREQITWELAAQQRASRILMYFAPETRAAITLLELGLFARSCKLVVCCPKGFWRKGNVDVVCARYGVPQVDELDALIERGRALRQ